jgi:hypothetical protein
MEVAPDRAPGRFVVVSSAADQDVSLLPPCRPPPATPLTCQGHLLEDPLNSEGRDERAAVRLSAEIQYEANPKAVFDMLICEAFQDGKCVAGGALSHEVRIERTVPDGATVTTRRTLPTDGVPDFARSFLGQTLQVCQVEHWGPAAPDGTRTGEVTVTVENAPVRFSGRLCLSPDGRGTVESFEGEVKASVPLLGAKVERVVEPVIRGAIRVEHRTGVDWLADR